MTYILKIVEFDGMLLTREIVLIVFDNYNTGVFLTVHDESKLIMQSHSIIFKLFIEEEKIYNDGS